MWCPVVFFHDLRGKSLDFSTETIQQHDFAPAGGEKHIGGPDAFGQRRGGDIYPVKHAEKLWSIGTDPPSWRIFHSYSLVYWEVPLNMFWLRDPWNIAGMCWFFGQDFSPWGWSKSQALEVWTWVGEGGGKNQWELVGADWNHGMNGMDDDFQFSWECHTPMWLWFFQRGR